MENPWEMEKRGGFPTMEAVCPCCGSTEFEAENSLTCKKCGKTIEYNNLTWRNYHFERGYVVGYHDVKSKED